TVNKSRFEPRSPSASSSASESNEVDPSGAACVDLITRRAGVPVQVCKRKTDTTRLNFVVESMYLMKGEGQNTDLKANTALSTPSCRMCYVFSSLTDCWVFVSRLRKTCLVTSMQ
ncbi:unnamed protein product, partial [Ectocarpus sp. 4 AP-2014]